MIPLLNDFLIFWKWLLLGTLLAGTLLKVEPKTYTGDDTWVFEDQPNEATKLNDSKDQLIIQPIV